MVEIDQHFFMEVRMVIKYVQVTGLGLLLFGGIYWYTTAMQIPNPLNKAIADTSVYLMGFSMILSGICYFWDFLDTKIIYRKYLGLIGFAFALVHIGLSFSALLRLFQIETWQKGLFWPALVGLVATMIFTVMAAISNQFSASHLGGKMWKNILHTGYIAMILILAHVVFLKLKYWMPWFNDGMKTLPSSSLLVSGFILIVVLMRVAVALSVRTHAKK